MAGRWIPGATINDALEATKHWNIYGINATLNFLGEEFTKRSDVKEALEVYLKLIKLISDKGLNASIAVKPTQLGLRINAALFASNYKRIVRTAQASHVFVWLDMEAVQYVRPTLKAYSKLKNKQYAGICIQSYLKSSMADLKRILKSNGTIRLVKGAYHAPQDIAFANRDRTTSNYITMMRYLFAHAGQFMVATHDQVLIRQALRLNKKYKKNVSFGMLNGIENQYAIKLARQHQRVSVYVPFGKRWLDYAYRRFKEIGNINVVLHSLFAQR